MHGAAHEFKRPRHATYCANWRDRYLFLRDRTSRGHDETCERKFRVDTYSCIYPTAPRTHLDEALQMETSLIFKTLLILTSQLSLTFGLTYGFIRACRHAHQAGQRFLGMTFDVQENTDGEIDLIPRNLQRRLITLSVYIWLFIAILMVLFARFCGSWARF